MDTRAVSATAPHANEVNPTSSLVPDDELIISKLSLISFRGRTVDHDVTNSKATFQSSYKKSITNRTPPRRWEFFFGHSLRLCTSCTGFWIEVKLWISYTLAYFSSFLGSIPFYQNGASTQKMQIMEFHGYPWNFGTTWIQYNTCIRKTLQIRLSLMNLINASSPQIYSLNWTLHAKLLIYNLQIRNCKSSKGHNA